MLSWLYTRDTCCHGYLAGCYGNCLTSVMTLVNLYEIRINKQGRTLQPSIFFTYTKMRSNYIPYLFELRRPLESLADPGGCRQCMPPPPPPMGSNSFIFTYVFIEKYPHQRWAPLNGKSWIRHCELTHPPCF